MNRTLVVASIVFACAACNKPSPRASTLTVSFYAQDSAFAVAEPLRVSVGSGAQVRSLRGRELNSYYPFLVSGEMPLDSAATLPIRVVMLGLADDTLAQARFSFGPVEPATAYTLGISAGGRHPASAPSRCGVQVTVPLQRAADDRTGDSLFMSISGMREGVAC